MQYLFSYFPSALPGFGLLALRLVLTSLLFVDGSHALGVSDPVRAIAGAFAALVSLLMIACAACVGIGLLTPLTQTIVVVIEVAMLSSRWWAPEGLAIAYEPWQARVCQAAIAASLALIGPGAYSVDAKLFGRREINIPPRGTVPIDEPPLPPVDGST